MKRRQMTKDELLGMMKHSAKNTVLSDRAPFTGMSVLCNYVLWKTEKFTQGKLTEYNRQAAAFDIQLDTGLASLIGMSDRLMKKAGFTIEYIPIEKKDIKVSRRNQVFYQAALNKLEAENRVNEMSTRYLIIAFNALMNMGYGEKRLTRFKDALNELLGEAQQDDGKKLLALRQELIDGVGVFIEMPKMEV